MPDVTNQTGLDILPVTQPHVVHLPVYSENAYQPNLMDAQRRLGWRVTDGGGGGNFIRTALRTWSADILHLHWLHPYLLRDSAVGSWIRGLRFLFEIALIRRRGTKIVWTVHNLSNHDQKHSVIELKLTRMFVRQVDLVVAHGQYAVNAARARFQIPEAIPTLAVRFPNYSERYQTNLSEQQCRQHWKTITDGTVIGFLGRVEPYKQVVELVRAFRKAGSDGDQLLIGGSASSDDYAAEVISAIEGDSRIRFLNAYLKEQDMASFLKAVDVVACPSKGILTSSSVPLAMSFGRPVVAPAEGCIPEEVGDTGYLYDGSQQGLQQALRLAIQQKPLLRDLGRAARQRAAEADPEKIARQILEQYRLLRPKPSDQGIQAR